MVIAVVVHTVPTDLGAAGIDIGIVVVTVPAPAIEPVLTIAVSITVTDVTNVVTIHVLLTRIRRGGAVIAAVRNAVAVAIGSGSGSATIYQVTILPRRTIGVIGRVGARSGRCAVVYCASDAIVAV